MAPLLCCGVRRRPSPDTGPVQLVNSPQRHGRFALTETNSPTESLDSSTRQATEIRQIFEAASSDERPTETGKAHALPKHESRPGVKRKESVKKIQTVASRVRKTMSRDSGMSKHSSKSDLHAHVSHEDTRRHEHSKRAFHERSQLDLLEDKVDKDDTYDEDAVPLKTPRSTWGREAVSSEIGNPPHDRPLNSSLPPLIRSNEDSEPRDIYQRHISRSVTGALSRMLTTRGSHAIAVANNDEYRKVDPGVEHANFPRSTSSMKYIFQAQSPTKSQDDVPQTRAPSPLERSDTVIRNPSSTGLVELSRPTFLNTLGTPHSPDLLPQRLDSISDSIADREWRLSYVPSHKASILPQSPESTSQKEFDDANEQYFDHLVESATAQEAWARKVSWPSQEQRYHHEGGPEPYDDGHLEIPKIGSARTVNNLSRSSESLRMPGAYERKHSSGSSGSVHLYNMRIPQRLASRGLLPSISQPYCGLPKKYAASSVYSHDSSNTAPRESHQNSLMFLNKIADRMNRYGPDAPAQDIISVPATLSRHVSFGRMDRGTFDTSFHSSKESLTNRELASVKVRILPRSKTFTTPKSSWFKEDLEEVGATIARTNPRQRSLSERYSLSNYDGNTDRALSIRPRGLSFVPGGEQPGASVWDQAIREHEQEDAALSQTRLGSGLLPLHRGRRSLSERPSFSFQNEQFRHHLPDDPISNPQAHRETSLQRRLGAYQLSTRTPSPRRRTPTSELKPVSTPSSGGSWTRYPSHDREQRCSSSAGEADNVYARDFAGEAATMVRQSTSIDPATTLPVIRPFPRGSDGRVRRKSKSMTFPRNVVAKFQRIYRRGSLEFANWSAYGSHGHRSSISVGRPAAYPELEMLAPVGMDFGSDEGGAGRVVDAEDVRGEGGGLGESSTGAAPVVERKEEAREVKEGVGVMPGARTWSKMYVEDCVFHPTATDEQGGSQSRIPGESGSRPGDEATAERLSVPVRENKGKARVFEHSSDDVRASTLDFKKSLEVNERMALEKVLGLGLEKGSEGVGGSDGEGKCKTGHEVEEKG